MPNYALICTKCDKPMAEISCTMAEREKRRCPCGGKLTNDYSVPHGAGFQLSGNDWPGKLNKLETHILKQGTD